MAVMGLRFSAFSWGRSMEHTARMPEGVAADVAASQRRIQEKTRALRGLPAGALEARIKFNHSSDSALKYGARQIAVPGGDVLNVAGFQQERLPAPIEAPATSYRRTRAEVKAVLGQAMTQLAQGRGPKPGNLGFVSYRPGPDGHVPGNLPQHTPETAAAAFANAGLPVPVAA